MRAPGFALAATLALALGGAAVAHAQRYPAKPIRIIVPVPPGGPTDVLARIVGERLHAQWGQPVIVENRSGAGGTIGLDLVARATPDGHTLGMLILNQLVSSILLPKLPYDFARDIVPVVQLTRQGNILVVHADLPARSVAELVAHTKAKPGRVNYASGGNGSPAHLAAELFKLTTGADMQHVPFKGAAPAVQEVLSGQTPVMFAASGAALPHIRSGRLRGLAVTSATRIPAVAELPTLAESGLPDFDVRDWQGMGAPRGVPPAILGQITAEVGRILDQPAVRERIAALGVEPVGGTSAAFGTMMAGEMQRWTRVVRDAGIRAD